MALFRGMRPDPTDQLPLVSNTASGLGVREGAPPIGDIPVYDGWVKPQEGGMSVVADAPDSLPGHRVPPPKGTGKHHLIFSLEEEQLPAQLIARQDQPENNPAHRSIEPVEDCRIEEFRQQIVSTRKDWKIFHE